MLLLVQQQNSFINQHIKSIKENIDKLELNQIDILNKINKVFSKVENSTSSPNGFLIKPRRRKNFNLLMIHFQSQMITS